jgi:predicted phage terminase large subunit-like protein
VQTRWHHDDLAGRLIEADAEGRWEVISLPAIAEEGDVIGRAPGEPLDTERFGAEALAELKEDIGERDWWAQYQGKPTPDEGDIFHRDWFVNEWPAPEREGFTFAYWDTAYGKQNPRRKGDRSVCGVWRLERNLFRLVHLRVGRPTYPDLKAQVLDVQRVHRPRAQLIEDHASGQSLIQDLRNETRVPIIPWKTGNESKEQRAKAVSPVWEAGRAVCSLPPAQFDLFVREHLQFPNSKFDDIVDMASMALAHLGIWNAPVRRRVVQRDFRIVA